MKVCEKVQKKGTTTYNEVADELVAEFTDPSRCTSPADQVSRLYFSVIKWHSLETQFLFVSTTKRIFVAGSTMHSMCLWR